MLEISTAGLPGSGDLELICTHNLWLWDKTWDFHCQFLIPFWKTTVSPSLPDQGHAVLSVPVLEPRGIWGATPWVERAYNVPSISNGVKRGGHDLTVRSLCLGKWSTCPPWVSAVSRPKKEWVVTVDFQQHVRALKFLGLRSNMRRALSPSTRLPPPPPAAHEGAQWTPSSSPMHSGETSHPDSGGTPSAGVDGLWTTCSPSADVCFFIGCQVTRKRQCMSHTSSEASVTPLASSRLCSPSHT